VRRGDRRPWRGGQPVAGTREPLQRGVRVRERRPRRQALGQERRAAGGERPAQPLGDALRAQRQYLAVRPIAVGLDGGLDLVIGAQNGRAVQADAVAARGGLEASAMPRSQSMSVP